MSKGVQEESP